MSEIDDLEALESGSFKSGHYSLSSHASLVTQRGNDLTLEDQVETTWAPRALEKPLEGFKQRNKESDDRLIALKKVQLELLVAVASEANDEIIQSKLKAIRKEMGD